MSLFEITVLVLLTIQMLMTAAVFGKVCMPDEQARDDMRYEREVERLTEEKAANNIDEGIMNIMSYSVNGKTGFEQDE